MNPPRSPSAENLKSELHEFAGNSFHEGLLAFFNNNYTMGEMPEEWKNVWSCLYTRKVKKTECEEL
jgi:hypothetical protein